MEKRDQWTSKIGFILAAAGSAIGLGAIWKFPYMAGMNGGSVFIFMFILSTVLIGLPILIAEFIIGRRGQADAVTAFRKLAPGTVWPLVGKMGSSCRSSSCLSTVSSADGSFRICSVLRHFSPGAAGRMTSGRFLIR